jgi:hypothetical protein
VDRIREVFETQDLATAPKPLTGATFRKRFDVFLFLQLNDRLASADEWLSFCSLLNNAGETQTHFWHSISGRSGVKGFDSVWSPDTEWVGGRSGAVCVTGDSGAWAMCIDNESGIAILGLDRTLAKTPRVMFQDMWISGSVVADRIGVRPDELDARYSPSAWFSSPSPDNPLWHKWCFECHVDAEDDKLFYWPQFEHFFKVLDPLLSGWTFRQMLSSQGFWRQVGPKKAPRISGGKAPVGGWQNFTHANCKTVATKFLPNNHHLQLQFNGPHDKVAALYPREPPGLIEMAFFWLRAARTSRRSPEEPAEFYFVLPGGGGTRTEPCNQYFELFALADAVWENDLESVVDRLAQIGHATAVYETKQPEIFYQYDPVGVGQVESIHEAGSSSLRRDGTRVFSPTTWTLRPSAISGRPNQVPRPRNL